MKWAVIESGKNELSVDKMVVDEKTLHHLNSRISVCQYSLSLSLSLYLSVFLSLHLSVSRSLYLSVSMLHVCVLLSVSLSISLSLYLYLCLSSSHCLYVSPFINISIF